MGVPAEGSRVICVQESSFIPTLTVWETLRLTMGLRIARKMDREEREETMNSILSSMGLSKVKYSRVRPPFHSESKVKTSTGTPSSPKCLKVIKTGRGRPSFPGVKEE